MSVSRKPWEHAKSSGAETDPVASRFVSSLDWDKRLYAHDINGSLAHARMLKHVGLLSPDELRTIEDGLKQIKSEIDHQGDRWSGWKMELEDVHMCIEAALVEKTGDAGRKLHTGRSRNDQVVLDLKLWIGDAVDQVHVRLRSFYDAAIFLSERYGHLVLPSYTHLQRAQPIVIGAELLAWASALSRAEDRMASIERMELPLGAGAVAGSGLPLDPEHTLRSSLLDRHLASLAPNSIEATASRDCAVDFVYALTMISMWLSRWAEQWILYASTEFGFICLDDAYTTGSSMMPQKQNPDLLELIRGKTGAVYGHLAALLTTLKGLPIAYNRDLQEDKRHVFSAFDIVCDCLDVAASIIHTTRFDEQRIESMLTAGYLDATSLAEYLVTKGVPFRRAHQVVGRLVRTCEADGLGELRKLSQEQINEAAGADICGADVYDWLGSHNVVRRYQTAGNAGLSGFKQQLAQWKERLDGSDPIK